ncbi:O-antigen ligase domain-containing protein [Aeromicrobium sp. S22]|uniref:O-antigen ligase family protein n=1 Tax=Aeromicrobium sp. S22 TaxID=2662029 RepID=UPI00129E39D7|nr:O-antigen ligase family protein [Aeromicrobium sp. S22]MRK00831.1 O-antigen ligase domain-containing protein [Aeromicrobium sp. S22]
MSLLSFFVLLLTAVPSRLTVAPLGAAGTPAQLVGLAAFVWWIYYEIQRPTAPVAGPQPVRTMYVFMSCAVLASYVAAMSRPIEASESSMADLGIVTVAGWGGILLLANDGIGSWRRLIVLLRRLVLAGGALATVGIVQFATGTGFVDKIEIPGLHANLALTGVSIRNGFNRPSGTALHPIEFGSVIAMILPIALTMALNERNRGWVRRWYPVGAIGVATALAISRSALIATLLALVILGASWGRARRVGGAAMVLVLGGGLFMTVPGLLGSLMGMFTGIGDDSSAQSRSGSYGLAFDFVERSPVVGRGLFTFLPRYRILDNQYLGLLIEVGVVGLVMVLGLIVAAIGCARAVRQHASDPYRAEIGQALVASIVAGAAGLALFDGFSFPMSAGLFFLMLGLAGAAWRLQREDESRDRSLPVRELGASSAAGAQHS